MEPLGLGRLRRLQPRDRRDVPLLGSAQAWHWPRRAVKLRASINAHVLGRHADREAAMRAIEKELESRMAQVQHDWMIYQALRKPLLRRFGRGLRHVELLLVLDLRFQRLFVELQTGENLDITRRAADIRHSRAGRSRPGLEV